MVHRPKWYQNKISWNTWTYWYQKMANTTLYIPEWYQKKVIPVQHWFCVGYLLGFLVWNCRLDLPNNQFKQHDRRLQSCLGIASNSKPIHATSPYTFSCWIANVVQAVKPVKIRFRFLSRCLKSCQWYVADNAFIWPFFLCNYDSLYYIIMTWVCSKIE